jgi:hypothetical protein
LFLGCGESGPQVIPVEGIVTLNGQPLDKASVTFMPAAGQPQSASGATDAAGKFSLVTYIGPKEYRGALPGAYKVAIMKSSLSGEVANESGLSIDGMAPNFKVEYLVPEKYSQPDNSGLTANVVPNMPLVKFELTK